MWQDDFHELPTRGIGKGLQGRSLPGRVRQRDAELEDRPSGRQDTGNNRLFLLCFRVCIFLQAPSSFFCLKKDDSIVNEILQNKITKIDTPSNT